MSHLSADALHELGKKSAPPRLNSFEFRLILRTSFV